MNHENEFLIDGKYSFKELVDIDHLRAMFEYFSKSTGFTTGLVSYPDQELLISTGWRDICTQFHRAFPESAVYCKQSTAELTENLKALREMNVRHCANGLVDGATPIIIRGAHVADLASGQILFEKPDLDRFRKQGKSYGYDVDAYIKSLETVPVVTEEAFKNAMGFLCEMSVMLAEQGLAVLRNRDAIQAVQKSENHLRITLSSIGDAVIATDSHGKITNMNPAAEELTGWPAQEALGKDLRDVLHIINAKTREVAENPLAKVLASGKIVGLANHTILISKSGLERQIADSVAPIMDADHHISGVVLVFRDVTEKYRMEEALEKRVVALTQPLEGGTITFDDLFNLNEIQRIQDEFAQATGVASIITHTDGTPITKASNFTDLCINIIRKTELGCANCFKSAAAIGRHHPEGPIVQPCLSGGLWDAGASIIVGGRHIANWLIGQVRDETQTEESMRAYARKIGVDESSFMRAFHKVPVMSHAHFQQIAQALFTLTNQLSTTAYQNVQQARFIAERRKAEEALHKSEDQLRFAMEANHMGVWTLDFVNHSATRSLEHARIFGYSDVSSNWTYEMFLEHVLPEDRAMVDHQLQHAIQTHGDCKFECRIRRVTKDERWIWATGRYQFDSDGAARHMVGIVQDITERKRVEAELLKMQKLSSVGTLAGGIAHDFNNILMGLFGNISLAKTEIPKDHSGFKPLEDAEKSMFRAIRLTKQLLTFAKGGEPVKEDVNLGTLVEEVAQFDLSGSNVMLAHKQPPDLWLANIDKGQIQQVITNLALNAREAMPSGGHLYITFENAEIDNDTSRSLHPGKYVKLSFKDEGSGIDPKIIDRIFDPYFTTKHTGSGLGLAAAYSIITKHGGHIGVESELGKGTTFTLYLPASKSQTLPRDVPFTAKPVSTFPAAKILVMDDEEFICMVVPRWLTRKGCAVETASDGRQAVEMYKRALETGTPFDLLILDLTIPGGIGGQEVLKELLAIDPAVKAIVSSGYAESSVMSNFGFYGFKGVLAKPYTENQLQAVIRDVLK